MMETHKDKWMKDIKTNIVVVDSNRIKKKQGKTVQRIFWNWNRIQIELQKTPQIITKYEVHQGFL